MDTGVIMMFRRLQDRHMARRITGRMVPDITFRRPLHTTEDTVKAMWMQ